MVTLSLILPSPESPIVDRGEHKVALYLISTLGMSRLFCSWGYSCPDQKHKKDTITNKCNNKNSLKSTEGQRIWHLRPVSVKKMLYKMVGIKIFNSPVSVFLYNSSRVKMPTNIIDTEIKGILCLKRYICQNMNTTKGKTQHLHHIITLV